MYLQFCRTKANSLFSIHLLTVCMATCRYWITSSPYPTSLPKTFLKFFAAYSTTSNQKWIFLQN